MSEAKKYVNVAFNAYAVPTTYICELEDVKQGDFVVVPTLSGENVGRVMSCRDKKVFTISLARMKKVKRLASPREINEVADLFGIPKNPAFADEEEEFSFFTNGGYGQRELNKVLRRMEKAKEKQGGVEKQGAGAGEQGGMEKQDAGVQEQAAQRRQEDPNRNPNALFKSAEEVPDYWRYVALGILALYFLKDYILD